MCGRYTADFDALQALVHRLGLTVEQLPFGLGLNLTPGRLLPIVTQEAPQRLAAGWWGYRPAWAAARGGKEVINARAETLTEKPYFRGALRARRCLVPASGFYEWKGPVPHHFRLTDRAVFCLAGIYEPRALQSGDEVPGFAIITTAANEVVAPVHHRMPVILPESAETAWLDPCLRQEVAVGMLRPIVAAGMRVEAVSVP